MLRLCLKLFHNYRKAVANTDLRFKNIEFFKLTCYYKSDNNYCKGYMTMEKEMILRTPAYYEKFQCIAEKCSDNCCIGWEIDIDKETMAYYKNVSGDFGKRLNDNIKYDGTAYSFILKNERCPFLNEKNLCDIFINCGERRLCQICTDHPRYFEWFGKVKEGGIGLCCEEAARIILSDNSPLLFSERKISYEGYDDYDERLYLFLSKAREKLFEIITDKSLSFSAVTEKLYGYCINLQKKIYDKDYALPTDISADFALFSTPNSIFNILEDAEEMDLSWKPMIHKAKEYFGSASYNIVFHPETEKYLRNLGVYFIWRYFLKSVFDYDVIEKINIILFSILTIAYLFEYKLNSFDALTFKDCVELSKAYSKEIEYNEENLILISQNQIT